MDTGFRILGYIPDLDIFRSQIELDSFTHGDMYSLTNLISQHEFQFVNISGESDANTVLLRHMNRININFDCQTRSREVHKILTTGRHPPFSHCLCYKLRRCPQSVAFATEIQLLIA